MSRTYKDTGKNWRYIKNSLYKKELSLYSEDIVGKRKDKRISRHLRKKLKRKWRKDIDKYDTI